MSSDQKIPNIAKPVLRMLQQEVHVVPQGQVLTEDLFNKIVATTEYHLYDGTTMMSCTLKLRNGFSVVGHFSSLPTSQFNLQLSMQYALQDAKNILSEALSLLIYDLVCPERLRITPSVESTLNALKESENA